MASSTGMNFDAHQQAVTGLTDTASAYKARLNQMTQSADAILAGFKGQASKAFIDAHERLHQAATKQHQLLDESTAKHTSARSDFDGVESDSQTSFSHINL